MSASTLDRPRSPAPRASAAPKPVTFRRVLSSEWLKFWTLRSTVGVLAAAVVGMVGIALIVAMNTRHISGHVQLEDLVPSATMQGYYLGQLLVGALGVLYVSGEYSTGMIRSTMGAVPKRLPVLGAKFAVFLVVAATSMILVALAAFLAAQAVLSRYRVGYSLGDPGVLRVVVGTGIYLTMVGLLGMALGWIVRSTPGALVAYVATILVLPAIFANVLGTWGKDIAQFLPSQAGASFSTSFHESPSLSPWTGLGVMALWVVVGLTVAALELRQRDV